MLLDTGGRVAFGYGCDVVPADIIRDTTLLFNRMNGTIEDGKYRVAREAWGQGGFTASTTPGTRGLAYVGNLDTTLCPSVRNPGQADSRPVAPLGAGAGTFGSGRVRLDTVPDSTVAATEALTFRTLNATRKDGTDTTAQVRIYDLRWSRNQGKEPYTIEFRYQVPSCIATYTVEMTLHADKVRAATGGQQLDGGVPAREGIAPNADNFVWTFSK